MKAVIVALLALAACDSIVDDPCAAGYQLSAGTCVPFVDETDGIAPDAGMNPSPPTALGEPTADEPTGPGPDAPDAEDVPGLEHTPSCTPHCN